MAASTSDRDSPGNEDGAGNEDSGVVWIGVLFFFFLFLSACVRFLVLGTYLATHNPLGAGSPMK